jgi:hypothetical protein
MKKIDNWQKIPEFRTAPYHADVPLDHLKRWVERQQNDAAAQGGKFEMCPDFQRGHVWTADQQVAYVEFFLRGGKSAREIYWNHPGWMGAFKGDMVLVDGLQRITALLAFLNDEIPAFGTFRKDFTGHVPLTCTLRMCVCNLKTRAEVLAWYIELNEGGVVHTAEEIARVKAMLVKEQKNRGVGVVYRTQRGWGRPHPR